MKNLLSYINMSNEDLMFGDIETKNKVNARKLLLFEKM